MYFVKPKASFERSAIVVEEARISTTQDLRPDRKEIAATPSVDIKTLNELEDVQEIKEDVVDAKLEAASEINVLGGDVEGVEEDAESKQSSQTV